MKFLLLFFFFTLPLYGKEELLETRENYFLTATDYKIAPKVNPITGEYSEEELTLVIAGGEPLSVRRFYNHRAPYDPRYATWRYNPETFCAANFELAAQEIFAAVGETDGSIYSFTHTDTRSFHCKTSKCISSFTGQSHPLNTTLCYNHRGDPKDKRRFEYLVNISDGSGRKRSFISPMHRWKDKVHYTQKRGDWIRGGSENQYAISPMVWTPYQVPIAEEKLPNGNSLVYTYTPWKEDKYNYPRPRLLSSITAYNANKSKVLGYLNFRYHRFKENEIAAIEITGSDNRKAYIQHGGIDPILCTALYTPDQPATHYSYQNAILTKVEKPEGRILSTTYHNNKVSAHYAPVGDNGKLTPIHRYEYNDCSTTVYDAENHKTIYQYDTHKRITAIVTELSTKQFTWDPTTGNLLSEKVGDHFVTYKYDKNQNLIEETHGDSNQQHTIYRTYSNDGFNLKLSESDRPGKQILYHYIPNTNLLHSELFLEQNLIKKRRFCFYDECAFCIKEIIDDGSSENSDDLTDVTYRKIRVIQPKYSLPCFGLPLVVEERTIDSAGQEILLNKVAYSYTPSGKILTEEHYDATNTLRYTLANQYDKIERLIQKKDALGNITRFSYDANNNLLSISGPRPDQHLAITYDKANRPIRFADGETVRERRYDKLGQLITEIDASHENTHFTYDALGRIIATRYPDGAIERKEYDALGNITKVIDPEGYITATTYSFRGQPLTIAHPDGTTEEFTYHPWGDLITHKDHILTAYEYDIFGNITRTQTAHKITSATYSPFSQLTATDGEGIITHYAYDYAGRKISETKADFTTTYSYDPLGRLTSTHTPTTTYSTEFDLLDRSITEQTLANDTLLLQKQFRYDPAGYCTEQDSITTTYTPSGKPLSITDPVGNTTTITYSYAPYTETFTSPKGIITEKVYNSRGQLALLQKKNGTGIIQKCENSYNKNNSLIQATHTLYPKNLTLTYHWSYGPEERLESETGIKKTLYNYNALGQLASLNQEIYYTYDPLGRLSRHYGKDFDYHYTYDNNDRIISIYDAFLKTTTHRLYDAHDNLIQETLGNGLTLTSTYSPENRTSLQLPDNSRIHYTYLGPFLKTVTRTPFTFTYAARDLEGNLLTLLFPSGKLSLQWDALNRCTHIEAPHYTTDLFYDAHSNLINSLSYDDLDQLDEGYDSLYNPSDTNALCQLTTCSYDANGNLLYDGKHHYTYDSLDRLIQLDQDRFTYDAFHRRLTKNQERYLWDGENEIGMVDKKLRQLRILGEGPAETGTLLLEIDNKSYIPLHDQRGCIVRLLDPKGQLIESYNYTPFGTEDPKKALSPWRFASKRAEGSLYYFGRRYYAPHLKRWLTPDPLGYESGANPYAYLDNNPLNDIDPYGLWSWNDTYEGAKSFGKGAFNYTLDGLKGANYTLQNMGQWMYADFQYEHFNDPSYFHTKSATATQGWKNLGRAIAQDPLGSAMPGLAEAWRMPSDASFNNKAQAWGKAAVDVALLACSAAKVARVGRAASIGRVGQCTTSATRLGTQAFTEASLKDISFSTAQLQHSFKHAKDFGIIANANNQTLSLFGSTIKSHIYAPGTQAIQGTYRGKIVTHFVNPQTRLNVIRDPRGNLISGWKLSPKQLEHIIRDGKLGGG